MKNLKLHAKLLGIVAILAGGLYLASCNGDQFLEVSDPNAISPDEFPTDIADFELMLVDLYGRLRYGYYFTDNFPVWARGPIMPLTRVSMAPASMSG